MHGLGYGLKPKLKNKLNFELTQPKLNFYQTMLNKPILFI